MDDNSYDEGYRAGMQRMREVGQSRIEELEASKNEALNQLDSALYSVSVLEKRVKSLIDESADLKAKLAKAVAEMKSLTDASTLMQSSASYDRFKHNSIVTESIWSQWSKQLKFARTAIKELTGGKDE